MDVNKCNITKYAAELYNSMKWGTNCSSGTNRNILENYINYLTCEDVNLIVCSPDDCSNPTIISTCTLDIIDLTVDLIEDDEADIAFSLQIGDYTGGILPFTYLWSFDNTYVENTNGLTNQELKLKTRDGVDLDFVIFGVELKVIDSAGCEDIGRFIYTPSGIIHAEGYTLCPNPGILEILPPTL